MATPWPATLPQCPVLNGFSEQRQRNVVAFTPDVGPPKMRRRSTASSTLTSVAYRMTKTQLDAFNTFYETTLADGSLPFDWRHPVTGVTYTWVFKSSDAPKRERMTPNTFRVTFDLVRMP